MILLYFPRFIHKDLLFTPENHSILGNLHNWLAQDSPLLLVNKVYFYFLSVRHFEAPNADSFIRTNRNKLKIRRRLEEDHIVYLASVAHKTIHDLKCLSRPKMDGSISVSRGKLFFCKLGHAADF